MDEYNKSFILKKHDYWRTLSNSSQSFYPNLGGNLTFALFVTRP